MSPIAEHHQEQILALLGRPLSDEERIGAATLPALSAAALDVARTLSRESRILAVIYLRALVPTAGLGRTTTFLEDVVEGRMDAERWERSLPK